MRKGYNPFKDNRIKNLPYTHQVVIPVFIPHQQDYFKDTFDIFKLCLKSLFETCHSKTWISVVDNGSCKEVHHFLEILLSEKKIHELITTENVGKLNAIVKGVAGHNFPLVTIADADILFLEDWQIETTKIFNSIPKAGIVGLIPQFVTYQDKSENVLLDYLWSNNLQFIEVINPKALAAFYKSIGWKPDYHPSRLKYTLALRAENGLIANVGSGHAVATYRRELFDYSVPFYNDFHMGGGSEQILDSLAIKNGYYRLTTYNNFAYHMGNIYETWMDEIFISKEAVAEEVAELQKHFRVRRPGLFANLQIELMKKVLKSHKLRMLFLMHKGLPKEVRKFF